MEIKEQSINKLDLILSYKYWTSEAALVAWRRNKDHRYSQTQGKKRYLRIIVFELSREFGPGVEKAKAKSCLMDKILFKNVFLHCKSPVKSMFI